MAYKVTISDGTILEKSIESVIFNVDPPPDNHYCMHTYTINSMQITGRIGAGERTISLYEWALLPANNPDCYKEIVVEQTHAGQIVRNVKFSKAFVVDYSESYSKGEGLGLFSIFIRQLAEVDIECTSEVIQQAAMTELSNETEEQSLPPVQAAGIASSPITKKNRPNFTDIIAKKKATQEASPELRAIEGRRQPAYKIISEEEQIRLSKMYQEMGGDPNRLVFNSDKVQGTSFRDADKMIHIKGDIYPLDGSISNHPRSIMSERAALAHEHAHLLNDPSPYIPGHFTDEYNASLRAAKEIPNLSEIDRVNLAADAELRVIEARRLNNIVGDEAREFKIDPFIDKTLSSYYNK